MKKGAIHALTVFMSILLFSCHEEDQPEIDKTDFLRYALTDKDSNNKSEAFLIQGNTIHIMAPLQSDLTALTHEFSINGISV